MTTIDDAAALLSLIAARAEELRAAGVVRVELGLLRFTLAPLAPAAEADMGDVEDDEEEPDDPLHDPWTHGVPNKETPKKLSRRNRRL